MTNVAKVYSFLTSFIYYRVLEKIIYTRSILRMRVYIFVRSKEKLGARAKPFHEVNAPRAAPYKTSINKREREGEREATLTTRRSARAERIREI